MLSTTMSLRNCDSDQLHGHAYTNKLTSTDASLEHRQRCLTLAAIRNPHAHHNRTADRSRFPSNKPPALNSKTTTTPVNFDNLYAKV